MSDNYFEEVPESFDESPPSGSMHATGVVLSEGEIRLLMRFINEISTAKNTSCILPDIFYSALCSHIPEDMLEEWKSPVIAMSVDKDAEWVQSAVAVCYEFWDADFIKQYIYGFFKQKKITDEETIQKLCTEMVGYLPQMYQSEDSPQMYKVYKAICVQITLTGVDYPIYTFNTIKSGMPTSTSQAITKPEAKPRVEAPVNSVIEKPVEPVATDVVPETEDDRYRQLQEQHERELKLERQKWQLETEELRNKERARRQQEYLDAIQSGTYGQKKSGGSRSNNIPQDFSPQISKPVLILLAHAILCIVIFIMNTFAGILSVAALGFATLGFFSKDNPNLGTITKLSPSLQIIIGYAAFVVVVLICFV